ASHKPQELAAAFPRRFSSAARGCSRSIPAPGAPQESVFSHMSRPRLNKPNPAIERLYREAEEAWGQQDYQKSISLIERATRKEPRNPSLVLDLARAYGQRYDFPAAERYIEKAVQISTDRAHTLGAAGRICLEFENID